MTIAATSLPSPADADAGIQSHAAGLLWLFRLSLARCSRPLRRSPSPFLPVRRFLAVSACLVGTPTAPAAVLISDHLAVASGLQPAAADLDRWGYAVDRPFSAPTLRALTGTCWRGLVLAMSLRVVLGWLRPPTPAQRTAHQRWQIRDPLLLYVATTIVASRSRAPRISLRAVLWLLPQPLDAAFTRQGRRALHVVRLCPGSTGRGTKIMVAVLLFRDPDRLHRLSFRFPRRVHLPRDRGRLAGADQDGQGRSCYGATAGLLALIRAALFWTSVEIGLPRMFAAGSDGSQNIVVPPSERMAYLGDRLITLGA